MNARICTNPKCRTVQPFTTCNICDRPTEPLPTISLAPIGANAAASLYHDPFNGYTILVSTSTRHRHLQLRLTEIVQHGQPLLYIQTDPTPLSPQPTTTAPRTLIPQDDHPARLQSIINTLHLLLHTLHPIDYDNLLCQLTTSLNEALTLIEDPPEEP